MKILLIKGHNLREDKNGMSTSENDVVPSTKIENNHPPGHKKKQWNATPARSMQISYWHAYSS